MNSLKKCKVVMLPTGKTEIEPRNLVLGDRLFQTVGYCRKPNGHFEPQHLYIISDDEIKEGDFLLFENNIVKCLDGYTGKFITFEYLNGTRIGLHRDNLLDSKKVIASTDPSLNLPQPSKHFIKKYIKGYNSKTPIEEVMVESIEDFVFCNNELKPYPEEYSNDYRCPKCGNNTVNAVGLCATKTYFERLKTDKNDCITIRPIKDSWSRDEVIEFGLKCVNLGMDLNNNPIPRLNEVTGKQYYYNWIKENL